MEIKTKFNVDDKVFYLNDGKIEQATIRDFNIEVIWTKQFNVYYTIHEKSDISHLEENLFSSPQDLITSLMDSEIMKEHENSTCLDILGKYLKEQSEKGVIEFEIKKVEEFPPSGENLFCIIPKGNIEESIPLKFSCK